MSGRKERCQVASGSVGCGGVLQRKSGRTGRNADGSDAGSVFADEGPPFAFAFPATMNALGPP